MRRRLLQRALTMAAAATLLQALGGCGFRLREAPRFAYATLGLNAPDSSPLMAELRRQAAIGGGLQVVSGAQMPSADVVLEMQREQREKVVVGVNASGGVREFQLRLRVQFRVRARDGRELVASTELLQQRDITFNESAALAKESEEALLFRQMQIDVAQQLLLRLAAVRPT